jgi:hypothetical protein
VMMLIETYRMYKRYRYIYTASNAKINPLFSDAKIREGYGQDF